MSGRGEKRSRREDAAVGALLSSPTIEAAAERTGVSTATLRRWLADPAFQRRYRDARRQVVEHAVSGLQRASGEAVDTLRRNLTCGVPTAEIGAAKSIMDFSLKAVELVDLAERVEQLEQAAAAVSSTGGRR